MDDRQELIETIFREMREVIGFLHRRSPPQLDNFDLTMAQFKVLAALACRGPTTVRSLAEHLQIGSPTASHLVDRLTTLGLVTRREDERDRRRTLVQLSAEGEAFLRQFRQGNEQHWRDLLTKLTDDELLHLLIGVRALTRAARALLISNHEVKERG